MRVFLIPYLLLNSRKSQLYDNINALCTAYAVLKYKSKYKKITTHFIVMCTRIIFFSRRSTFDVQRWHGYTAQP